MRLSIRRVLPMNAATAIKARFEIVVIGSSESGSTISK